MNTILDEISLGGIVTIRDQLIALQKEGKKIYRLESGDPSFSVAPHISEAITKALKEGYTHYTLGAGIIQLREAICEKLYKDNKIKATPNNVFVTNGAMHALYIVFRALCSSGTQILVPTPTWTETADNVVLADGRPIYYKYDDISTASNKASAIVINSPHNPTGMVISEKDMNNIIDFASRNNMYIISDEAYEHVLYDNAKHISPASFGYDKVISIYSFSKSYAMSGLRLGYIVSPKNELSVNLAKLLRCTVNGINSATQWGGVAALQGPQEYIETMRTEYQKRRDILCNALKDSKSISPIKPQGAFYLWTKINQEQNASLEDNSWNMTKSLIQKGIGSAPGIVFGPGGANHIRFAFSCSTEQIIEASYLLNKILK